MIRTVYIETTIPSFYYETRRTATAAAWREATRAWWDECSHRYQLYTSRFVLYECERAPKAKALKMLRLIQGIELLDEPPELEDVVDYYVQHHAMPAEADGDAYHLAIASLQRMDCLLTWNCQHLANVNKVQHLMVLNGRLGLPTPAITTPYTLIPEAQR